jgi:uncharacterized protein YecT (DUF1311 family)/uncharacterized caspase-like protein
MKKLLLTLLLAATTLATRAEAQTITQEQCKQADAQLNQVYQQLRGTLNDAQKQQLKLAQRDWIKKRDAFVAANPGNPQGALCQATMQRVTALQEVLRKVQGKESANTQRVQNIKATDRQSSLQNTGNTKEAKILPTPQILGGEVIESVSITDKGKFVTIGRMGIGGAQPMAEIWDMKTKSLLHSFISGSEFVRTIPDKNILITLGKISPPGETITGTQMRDARPVLQYYSTIDRKRIANFTFTDPYGVGMRHAGSGHAWHNGYYITRDGKYAVVEAMDDDAFHTDGRIGERLFYLYILPDLNSAIGTNSNQLNPIKSLTKEELEIKFPEIIALNRNINNLCIHADANLEILNNETKTVIQDKKSGERIVFSKDKIVLNDGLSISKDGALVAFYGKNKIRITDTQNLHSTGIISDFDGVEAAAISPDNQKVAILGYKIRKTADSGKESSDNGKEYVGLIAEVVTGDILSKTSIAPGIVPNEERGINELRWINNLICLANGAKFDSKFNFVASIKGCFFPASAQNPEILVKRDELQQADELERRKSSTNVSVIDPDTLNVLKHLPYDSSQADPTCPDLLPFDVSENHDSILKGWKYWRSGEGGMFIIKGDEKIEFDASVGGRLPQLCRFLVDGSILTAAPSEDGSQTILRLISSKSGHSIKIRDGQLYTPGSAINPIASTDIPVSETRTSRSGDTLYGLEANGVVARYQVNPQSIAHVVSYLSSDTCSLAFTPDYFYLSRGNPYRVLSFTKGLDSYPLEQFDLRLNRPDIVLERLRAPKEAIETAKSLRDKRLKRMGVTEEMLKPDFHLPELQIVGDVPATTPKDQLNLQIKAMDDKYPLDRLRVYVNNVPVNGRDGELLRDQKTQTLEKSIPIKLASGRNKIQVSVLNSAGAESLYANAEVNCTAERPKPKLYAVALGVSQYDRPEWCLKYAAKDATDLIGKLKARAGSTYSEVKPLLLTDKDVTKESAAKIKEFLSGATIDDTVLIFMAGHGLLDDKYDYYFGTSDIDPAKPSERGIPYDAIDTILAEVPSLRKALLMDTCHAGELDDDEKKELASSDGKGTLPAASSTATDSAIKGTVAMRAIGTRGMQVKAVEGAKGKSDWYEKLQDMFVDLRRGSGATVISSSQGAEYAFESSEQSNGLFTYALMEALEGKATPNKDGKITISAIGDYVKKRVQDLTKGKQNPNLRGVNLEEDFTLSSTK